MQLGAKQERNVPRLSLFGDYDMASNLFTPAAKWIAGVAFLTFPVIACEQSAEPAAPGSQRTISGPNYTLGSGSVSTLIGRGTFTDPFKINRKTGDWKIKVDSDPMDIAVQQIVFPAHSHSGWHGHPGPVFIMVAQGTMTFYESDDPTCTPIVRTAGQGYLDRGDGAHIARNETEVPAKNIVTYFAPPGAALRIDKPNPGNCPF